MLADGSARLQEIVENLHRSELTVQEHAEHGAEWVRVLEEKRKAQHVAQLGPPGGKQPRDKGIRSASRDLGLERKVVARALKIAGITPEAKEAARSAGLENHQNALLKVAQAEPERQAWAQGSFMRLGAL